MSMDPSGVAAAARTARDESVRAALRLAAAAAQLDADFAALVNEVADVPEDVWGSAGLSIAVPDVVVERSSYFGLYRWSERHPVAIPRRYRKQNLLDGAPMELVFTGKALVLRASRYDVVEGGRLFDLRPLARPDPVFIEEVPFSWLARTLPTLTLDDIAGQITAHLEHHAAVMRRAARTSGAVAAALSAQSEVHRL